MFVCVFFNFFNIATIPSRAKEVGDREVTTGHAQLGVWAWKLRLAM